MPAPPIIPQFTMGQNILPSFLQGTQGITNALGQWQARNQQADRMAQQQQQFEAGNKLAQARMAQSDRHFGMSHDLAKMRAGSDAQANALRLKQLELGIQQARVQGAREEQLWPYKLEAQKLAVDVAKANAGRKDVETQMLQGLGLVPGASPVGPDPNIRPQSFDGGGQPMAPMNALAQAPQQMPQQQMLDDPNFIRTQAAPMAPNAEQPATPRDVIQNMTPAQRAQFGLSMIGKGDAAKVLGEAASQQKLGKEARNDIDKREVAAVDALARVKNIASQYKDEYLTVEGKLKAYGLSWLDSFGSLRDKMSPEDADYLDKITAFQRDAFEHLTQGIKDATGAAMGVQEEKRIRMGLPDPQKDSPRVYMAKLRSSMESYELAIQRTQFMRQNGFEIKSGKDVDALASRMPFERFRELRNDSRAIYQKMKSDNPNADDGEIRGAVRQQILKKYRINI